MTRVVLKDAKTPNGDSLIDEVNDSVRVTIASGSFSITSADGAVLDGVDPLIKGSVLDLVNTNPQAVAIVDGTGSQITSFGGGTQYTEGDVDATITGTALLWEDAADTLRAVSASKPLPIGDAGGSLTVDGAFFQATQPVSIAAVVHVDDNAGSLTVDGTFFQATQPVSIAAAVPVTDNAGSLTVDGTVAISNFTDNGLTDTQLRASAVPVSGTFFQVTQPVSATNLDVALSTLLKPADTLTAVTTVGTITNVVHVDDNAGSLTVDGTFWQVTQPVSIASAVAVTGPLTDTQLRASPVSITGSISASSVAKVTADDPTYTEGASTDFSQDLAGRLRTKTYVLVNDTPEVYIAGDIKPLSMTNDGRLRVASLEARTGESWLSPGEAKMWGSLEAQFTHTGSPWGEW